MLRVLNLNTTLKLITFIDLLTEPFIFHLSVEDDVSSATASSPLCCLSLLFELSLSHTITGGKHLLECPRYLRSLVYQIIVLFLLNATILNKCLIFTINYWFLLLLLVLSFRHGVKFTVSRNHDGEFLLLLLVILIIELSVKCVHLSEFATSLFHLFLIVFAKIFQFERLMGRFNLWLELLLDWDDIV